MLINYLKTTFRAIRHSSVYGFLNIAGLALGIACAALIFIWVEGELSFDHQYFKHNELYSIRMNIDYSGRIESYTSVPGPMSGAIRGTVPGIVNNSRIGFGRELFTLNDKITYERGFYVDTSFFSMLQLPFVRGNAVGFNNPHSLVLSENMAKKFFGDIDPIGKTLQVDNHQSFIVIGVVSNPPPNVSYQFSWLAPVSNFLDQNKWLGPWDSFGISTVVELQPGTDVNLVNRQLTGILQPKDKLYSHASCLLWSMNDWHLRDVYTNGKPDGGLITQIRLFSTIAWIILLIGCINFMNLATARAGQRAREIGVRKTLGALRKSLIGQFLVETLAMSFLALGLAVGLIYLSLPAFNGLVRRALVFNPLAPVHLLGLLSIGGFCGLIAGSYPAFYLSSFRPVDVLKGQRIRLGNGAGFIRKGLVVTQFTVSVVLIVSTVIIYQQVQHVKDRDLGYNKEHLIYSDMSGNLADHFNAFRADLLQTGAVEDATITNSPPLQMWSTISSSQITWEGSNPENKTKIIWESTSPQYLRTMGLSLRAGRDFHTDIRSDSGNVIINETMAALMGKAGRVGSLLTYDKHESFHVIGIVKDYLFNDMYERVSPVVLACDPETSANYHFLTIRLRPGKDLAGSLTKVEAVTKAHNPGYPVDYQFVDRQFDNIFWSENRIGRLAAVFSILAIFISCIGLFGLAAYTAERRTKEIGIRKVLGASVVNLAALLSNEFLRLVVLSCLIAFPLAWWGMNKYLADYAYRITIHWWVLGLAGIAAILIALLTVSFQAVKAALSNPVKTLRSQ